MTSPAVSVSEPKALLRREALARRRAIHREKAVSASAALAGALMDAFGNTKKIIAGYWPIGDEIDCRPALTLLAEKGFEIVLPVVAGQGQVLIFRAWSPGDELEQGPFGTAHPGVKAVVRIPEVLLLPLIAFDHVGHRLGYGAGYYDRTLASLRSNGNGPVQAIGIAYDEQEIPHVPAGDHDQPMDAVVTDQRTLWFKGSSAPGP